MNDMHGQQARGPRPEPKASAGPPPPPPQPRAERCLIQPQGCPAPHERELLRYAQAMDFTLRHVRLLAEAARGGAVPAADILRALGRPYRLPLPGDAEALAAYRKVYGHGDRVIGHLAEHGECKPWPGESCEAYAVAAEADGLEALRDHGDWPPWEQPRRGAHGEAGG